MAIWWSAWRRCRSGRSEEAARGRTWLFGALALLLAVVPSAAGGGLQPELHRKSASHRLGVVAFYNPRLMYLKYQPLVDYLTRETGTTWELSIGRNYEGTVDALCRGDVDMAYLGPLTYVRAHAACGAVPVVRLATGGLPEYRSVILVREHSLYASVRDLAGATFAFGSPLSTSSHLVPRLMLLEAGLKPGENVVCRYFGHHDEAARAVLLGEADACGIRDIVAERFVGRGLRILARSKPIPNFPLVVPPTLPNARLRELIRVLVDTPRRNPRVREFMAGWDEEIADGFAPVQDRDYDPVRALVRKVFGQAGFTAPAAALTCGGGG